MKSPPEKVAASGLETQAGRCAARLDQVYTLIYLLLKIGLAAIFIYAGALKLLDPRAFAHALSQYDLLPEALLPLAAIGLPALEVLAGAGLLFQIRGSLAAIFSLLVLFLAALGYALALDLDIDCGCFTPAEIGAKIGVRQALLRDLLLLGATLFLFWRPRSRPQSIPNKATLFKPKGEK